MRSTGRSTSRDPQATARLRQKALRMKGREDKIDSIAKQLMSLSSSFKNPRKARAMAENVWMKVRNTDSELSLSRDQLKQLVKEINGGGAQQTQRQTMYSSQPAPQVAATQKKSSSTKPAPAASSKDVLNLLPVPNREKANAHDIWNDISEFNRAQQDADRQSNFLKKKKQQQIWQSQLQGQIKEVQDAQQREDNETRQYAQQMAAELQHFKKQEQQKMLAIKQRALEDKRKQDEQRKMQMDRRKQEEDRRQKDAEDMKNMLMKQMAADQKKDRDRKIAEKKKMERVQVENKANLAMKAKKAEAARHYDMKLQNDYVEMENKKERDRTAHLKAMADKIAAKMALGADAIAEQDNRDKENEERAKREQAKYNREREREDARRRAAAKQRTDSQLRVLKEQVEERERQQKQHELEMQEQANMWKKQTQDYDQSEQKKREMARRRNLDQQKWLKKQIIDKANSAGMCDQSALELQMNRSILRKIAQTRLNQSNSGMSVAASTRARSAELAAQGL